MAYTNNKFCWHGVISTDVDRAKAFYTEALGWSAPTMEMGGETAIMFAPKDGIPRAHLRAPEMPGVPSHWSAYLRVKDVDASTKLAVENGGTQHFPPTDIPPGRFSVIASPSGGVFCLFHEADPSADNAPTGEGSMHWTELHSQDVDADLRWLKATFGFETSEMPMPNGEKYIVLNDDGEGIGGIMKAVMPGVPSMWITWVQVSDCDATVARVKQHGGNALGEIMEMENVGRMCVVQDPTGGVFGVITPTAG